MAMKYLKKCPLSRVFSRTVFNPFLKDVRFCNEILFKSSGGGVNENLEQSFIVMPPSISLGTIELNIFKAEIIFHVISF